MNIDKELSQIYYNPSTGFVGPDKLYARVKNKGITKTQIQKWLSNQYVYQQQKIPKSTGFIPFNASRGVYQGDLLFYEKLFRQNSGYRYILTIIEIYSRKGFAIPLKKKNDAKDEIEKFVNKHKVSVLQVDAGGEVASKAIQTMLAKRGIKLSVARAEDHTRQAIVERFNKTIREMLGKYMQAMQTKKWYDVLPKFVDNYNSSVQGGINKVPNKVYSGKENVKPTPIPESTLKRIRSFKLGDKVKRKLETTKFQKAGKPRWSSEIYTISEVLPFSFKLKASNGVVLAGTYRVHQLQKIRSVQRQPQQQKGVVSRGDAKYREMPVERPKTRGKQIDFKSIVGKK